MRDAHARLERFGGRVDQLRERIFVPVHEALGRLFLLQLAQLLGVVARLLQRLGVLDLMLGRLGDHHAFGIEARTARATGDLMELAGAQPAHLETVELRERGQNDRVDGHIDTHA